MARKSLKKGLFITFEGPEGSGKSTQSKLLYEYLKGRSYNCVHTREPGGTKAGELIRGILLHSRGARLTDLTELLLFEACRSQVVDEVIRPALTGMGVVICDRFSDATLSYQGYGGGISLKMIEGVDEVATGGLKPDLTILLDIDTMTGLKRAKRKGVDRMESKDISYHKRVRAGYLKLAKKYPYRIKVISAIGEIGEIQDRVRQKVERLLSKYAV